MDITVGKELLKKMTLVDKILIVLLICGVGVFAGSLFGGIGRVNEPQVEFIQADQNLKNVEIVIDVAGAVVSPGVYKLPKYSRIKDALIVAGGLSASADREFVSTTINLAEVVNDGQKIYIPKLGVTDGEVKGYSEAKTSTGKININKANISELDTLEGIGTARASGIIEGRPYSKIEDLVSKEIISKTVFEKIKDKIAVY